MAAMTRSPFEQETTMSKDVISYEPAPLTIVELRVENVKRLRSVRIRPDGANVVVVGGRNAQGKSSLLDSIEMAIGGGKSIPEEPIRKGERTARIVADLGDIIVERTFTGNRSELVVKNAAGVPQKSPQLLLNSLCSRIAFDPFEFQRKKKEEQAAVIRELVPETAAAIAKVDERHAAAYAERTEANKAAKAVAARLDAMREHRDAPEKEVSVSALVEKLEAAHAHNKARADAAARVANAERAVASRDAEIARLHELLEAANKARSEALDERRSTSEAFEALAPEADTGPVQVELRGAEETNRKVRENKERALVREELYSAEKHARELTEELMRLEGEKQGLLEEAKLPVPGLGFDDHGPTLNGLPLDQASQAERLRVSIAIGIALNPRIKVLLVRDGSLLDEASMKLLAEAARDEEAQVFVERVSETGEGCSLVIEDGEVKASAAAAE
jgi:DNA repair exonuclease SbcCD ATPase subunit